MSAGLVAAAVASYLAAWALLVRRIARDGANRTLPLTAAIGAVLGLALHALALSQSVISPPGLDLGFFNAVSLVAWAIAGVLVASAATNPLAALGLVILPVAAVSAVLPMIVASEQVVVATAPGVQLHVVTSILAYSVLSLAVVQSVVVLVQERRLHEHRPGRLTRLLPPLQVQEALLVQMLAVGFFLLSLSLATGVMFVQDLLAQHLVHKTVLSTVAWLLFGTVLYGRWRHGWRGRTLSRWSLGGFCVLLLAYFGAKLVLEVVLGRTWTA